MSAEGAFVTQSAWAFGFEEIWRARDDVYAKFVSKLGILVCGIVATHFSKWVVTGLSNEYKFTARRRAVVLNANTNAENRTTFVGV